MPWFWAFTASIRTFGGVGDYFGVSKDGIRIISGRASNKKLVEVDSRL
jgi:uncharacterized protein YggU (UPF0235/DUF167 family)